MEVRPNYRVRVHHLLVVRLSRTCANPKISKMGPHEFRPESYNVDREPTNLLTYARKYFEISPLFNSLGDLRWKMCMPPCALNAEAACFEQSKDQVDYSKMLMWFKTSVFASWSLICLRYPIKDLKLSLVSNSFPFDPTRLYENPDFSSTS